MERSRKEAEERRERVGRGEEQACLILLYKRDLKTRHRLTAIAGRSSPWGSELNLKYTINRETINNRVPPSCRLICR